MLRILDASLGARTWHSQCGVSPDIGIGVLAVQLSYKQALQDGHNYLKGAKRKGNKLRKEEQISKKKGIKNMTMYYLTSKCFLSQPIHQIVQCGCVKLQRCFHIEGRKSPSLTTTFRHNFKRINGKIL